MPFIELPPEELAALPLEDRILYRKRQFAHRVEQAAIEQNAALEKRQAELAEKKRAAKQRQAANHAARAEANRRLTDARQRGGK